MTGSWMSAGSARGAFVDNAEAFIARAWRRALSEDRIEHPARR